MGLFDSIKEKLFNRGSADTGFMTDDEKELREYEDYYRPQSGVTDNSYAEFVVSDVFSIMGKEIIVAGTVTGGVFTVGDRVVIVHGNAEPVMTEIEGIEQFKRVCTSVTEGANAAFKLKYIDKKQISRNDLIKKA